jgi:hypothetical protein
MRRLVGTLGIDAAGAGLGSGIGNASPHDAGPASLETAYDGDVILYVDLLERHGESRRRLSRDARYCSAGT